MKRGMRIQTTKVYRLIEEAVEGGYTTVSLQGSSRSSKTYNTLIWLIVYCLKHPGTRLSIVRATLPALKGSVLVDFKEILSKMGEYDERRMNRSELTYGFGNGSWAEFFSCDSEQKLRGRKRDVLFVNEANELSYLEWQQLKMRTTRFAVMDYNPSFSDDHWICEVNRDERTSHSVTTYKDNPFLEPAIIEEIESLREKNPRLWQVYGLGQQAIVEGLVFPTFETVGEIPARVKRRYVGIDFGFTHDPTAIVEVGVSGDELWIDELAYRTEMLSGDIIRELKEKGCGKRVISESADPRLVEEIYRGGIDIRPVRKYPGSVEAGLGKMQELRLRVTRRSVNVIKELRNYTWRRDKEGKWLNVPEDSWNHAIDAVRYVVMTEVMGGERRQIDLERLQRLV